jgi:hypothetical protein
MNERIKELAKQAGILHKQIGPTLETRHMKKKEQDLEKFAELIVRECVEICGSVAAVKAGYNDAAVADTAYLCGDQIKEHFGVDIDE